MLPSFCRVTGNSRNLPKPNYFPLLPPISPVEARRLCRLMGKAVPSEDHQYVPLIEFARQSKAVKCHITSHADEQHHYQQLTIQQKTADKCRITAKHQINDKYKYLYPLLKENSYDMKQLKKILERMSSRLDSLTVQPGQRFVYQLDDNHLNLVLPAEMEAAIRRGEIENLLISKDGTTVLIRLKDGPSLTLTLKSMSQPTMEDGLLEGGGQDEEILIKQRQIRQYKKRKISDPKQYSIAQLQPPSPTPEEEEPVITADWNERMSKLTAGHRSVANLLALGTDWRDLLYPKIDTWDWDSLPAVKEEDTPSLPVRNVDPLQLPVNQLFPGVVPSNQVPVLNEDTVGFEAVPVYSEVIRPFKGQLSTSYIQALDKVTPGQTSSSSTSKLKDLFSDVESLMFLPFIHEVGTVMAELDRGTAGWMVRTEQDGVRFVKTRPADDKAKAISGLMVPVGKDEERFVVGQEIPPVGFVPGKLVGDYFQPGCVVQNPEGAGFIPGCIFGGVFAAGQITRRDSVGPPQFVTGQAVQTLFGPKFLPGRTIQTDEGLKFVAGQTSARDNKFYPGQIFQTASGPAFISGVTFDTPQGARFIAGQVDVEGQFVPGQVLMDGPNGEAEFTAGENLETADGPLFLPGQSYKTPDGRTKFCPGRQMILEDGQKRFVPGETMISKEGRQFVAGVLAEERFVPCQIDLKQSNGQMLRTATKEEEIFFCTGLGDGLPIDNSTFSAMPRKKPDMGYMIQHDDKVKFLPTEQNQDELLVGNEAIKVVPGQLLEMDDTPKFIPGKTIESALGNIFIPGQAVRTGPNKIEQFVPGQVIDTGNSSSIEGINGPMFCPGQMVNCESGKKFVPGQVFGSKSGPRFVPGKILMSPSGVSTFIPGQVVYSSDRGSVFVPGNIVDTSSGPFFVPGRVVDLPSGGIKFVAGEIIETDSGPRYVTEHETDLDLLDETEDQKEIVVQGFPVTPEELRLITAYPFAALHYPLKDGDSIINSRMLRQMAAAGVAVNKLTNSNQNNKDNKDDGNNNVNGNCNGNNTSLNDVKVVAPKDIDESILGANVFRTTEPPPKPVNNNKKKTEKPVAKDNDGDNQSKIGEAKPAAKPPDASKTPAAVVQPVEAVPPPSDDHVGPSAGSDSSEIPPTEKTRQDGDGAKGLAAETVGATTEPANSSRVGNETPAASSLGTETKPSAEMPVTAVPPPLTKTSENQQSQNDHRPPPPQTPKADETSTMKSTNQDDSGASKKPADDGTSTRKQQEIPQTIKLQDSSANEKPTEDGKSTLANGTNHGPSPQPDPVVVRPVDPPAPPQTQTKTNAQPPPSTPPATKTSNNNNVGDGLLLAKDKDDGSKVASSDPSIGQSSGNETSAGSDANPSRLNQQETKDDASNKTKNADSDSKLIAAVTGDKTPSRTCDPAPQQPTSDDGKADKSDGRDRDDSSVERQVVDIFERIKRDLDSVERDPFIKQTLSDAEALALASGRPDLADKVRQLLDILKNTERDPEVVELIKQILRMKKQNEENSTLNAGQNPTLDTNPNRLPQSGGSATDGNELGKSISNGQKTQGSSGESQSKDSLGLAGSDKNAANGSLSTHSNGSGSAGSGQKSADSLGSKGSISSSVGSSSADQNMSNGSLDSSATSSANQKTTKGAMDSSVISSAEQQKGSKGSTDSSATSSVDQKGANGTSGSSSDQKAAKGSLDSSLAGSSSDPKLNSQQNMAGSNSATKINSNTENVSEANANFNHCNGGLSGQNISDASSTKQDDNNKSSAKSKTKGQQMGMNGDNNPSGTSSTIDDGRRLSAKGSEATANEQQGGSGKAQSAGAGSTLSSSTAGGVDGSTCNGQGQTTSSSSNFTTGQRDENGTTDGDACSTSQHLGENATAGSNEATGRTRQRRHRSTNATENNSSALPADLASSSSATRPTELSGLDINKVLRTQKSIDSPSTENRSPIDESKMIDKWQYFNSPISSEPPSRFKDPNNNENMKPPEPVPAPAPARVRKISSEKRNPRRVSSRSSSRLCAMDLSEEMSDDNGDLLDPSASMPVDPVIGPNGVTLIPSVITSAKDISRDVIDTLRYSRDEAKKEYYTQKILEAVGLVTGQRSPSNESEEGSAASGTKDPGQSHGHRFSRSRKSSAASACIILKDFLQTIVPQEAAHNVLIGDIDYMVIDDEGVRYFESAMGFASRRNSRFDIRQAAATARSRSGSQDHTADDVSTSSGPWPWADVGPRSRRASIDEFRKRLLEQDATVSLTSKTRSPSRERPPSGIHGRHSVAAFPLSRTSSGYIAPIKTDRSSRRGSLVEDFGMLSSANAAALGRKRKVGTVDASINRQKRLSRTSFDGF